MQEVLAQSGQKLPASDFVVASVQHPGSSLDIIGNVLVLGIYYLFDKVCVSEDGEIDTVYLGQSMICPHIQKGIHILPLICQKQDLLGI